jgi:hypothetical protein
VCVCVCVCHDVCVSVRYTVLGKKNVLVLHCSLQRVSGRMLVHAVEVNNDPNAARNTQVRSGKAQSCRNISLHLCVPDLWSPLSSLFAGLRSAAG